MLIWATVLTNPGIPCTIYNIAGIAKEAYNIGFSKKNMESTFKATGVFPLNSDIYTDEDFLPPEVINRPNPTVSDETQQIEKTIVHSVNPPVTNPFPEQTQNRQLEYQPVQKSSTETNKSLINRHPFKIKINFLILITFLHLISCRYQKLCLENVLLNKKTKKTVVITSTPGKERLAVNLVRLGKKPLRRSGQIGNKDKKPKTRQDQKKAKSLNT